MAFRCTENSTPCCLRLGHLLGQEGDQRGLAHDGSVDDLARDHLQRRLEDGDGAIGGDVFDAQVIRCRIG